MGQSGGGESKLPEVVSGGCLGVGQSGGGESKFRVAVTAGCLGVGQSGGGESIAEARQVGPI